MSCDGLTLSSTVPLLTLVAGGPELALTSESPTLTLASDECELTLTVESSLAFVVTQTELELRSAPVVLEMTTPVAVGTGEANEAANVGVAGAGVYDGKTGVQLNFRRLRPLSPELSIEENAGDQTVDFDHRDGFVANCGGTDAVGDLVYIVGTTAGVLDVAPADPTDADKMPVRGVIEEKLTATTCFVKISGILTGLSDLTEGARLFAGAGGASHTVPTASATIVQAVGVAVSATSMYIDLSSQLMRRA